MLWGQTGREDRLEPDRTVSRGGTVSRTLPFQGPVSLQYCSYKAQIKAGNVSMVTGGPRHHPVAPFP